jgi:hypothetical protein
MGHLASLHIQGTLHPKTPRPNRFFQHVLPNEGAQAGDRGGGGLHARRAASTFPPSPSWKAAQVCARFSPPSTTSSDHGRARVLWARSSIQHPPAASLLMGVQSAREQLPPQILTNPLLVPRSQS